MNAQEQPSSEAADFDAAWERERERLDALAATFDPVTTRHLGALGPMDGWRCLEIGAGTGTVAGWLCERVGAGGHVVATDINTGFLDDRSDHPNLEVRRHDIACDPLDERSFDLIHARTVLEHVPTRDDVIARLAGALKPGGWLVIEDLALTPVVYAPPDAWFVTPERNQDLIHRVNRAIEDVLSAVGADPDYGRRLPGVLMSNGLEDVDAELTARLVRGATARSDYMRLSIELLRDALAEIVPSELLDEAVAAAGDPEAAWMSVPIVSAWGRRPADAS